MEHEHGNSDLKDCKVLIVEDEPTILRLLSLSFTRAGFTVFTAEDGEKGLAAAIAHRPAGIVLDVLMPKMDGTTMMKHIRKEGEWGKKVCAFAYTNLNYSEKQHEAFAAGIDEFLIKTDVGIADLIRRVRHACEAAAASQRHNEGTAKAPLL